MGQKMGQDSYILPFRPRLRSPMLPAVNESEEQRLDRLAYAAGRTAHMTEQPPETCPYGLVELRLRSWWMAGWVDRFTELNEPF